MCIEEANIHAPTTYSLSYGHMSQFDGLIKPPAPSLSSVLLTGFMGGSYTTFIGFQHLNTIIVAIFLMMRASDDCQHNGANWESSTPTATERALYLWPKTYTATARNGIIDETEMGT